jgi:lysyl-tRNA synthetase class 2
LLDESSQARMENPPADCGAGDIVCGQLGRSASDADDLFVLSGARVLARRIAPPSDADRDLAGRLPTLEQRTDILHAVREFFRERGFREVETPARVICPGLEPHLVPFPAGANRWLITSPELHLKRLLAAGAERIFEISRVWRGDERGDWHLAEFTMLEWYRAFCGLDDLVNDVIELLRAAARGAAVDPGDVAGCDLSRDPERLTVREAFRRYAGLELAELKGKALLAAALDRLGLRHAPDDGWNELYFRVFVERVEPHLGRGRVTILEEHPASQAALARVRDDPDWPVALRFEVYAAGIELANAFDELTDPVEQRRRHEADREHRRRHGSPTPDLDENFLAALAAGAPPAAGIALGLDRLVAVILGLPDIRQTVPFPES